MIDAGYLKDRLESAAYVMRMLPPIKIQGYTSSMPEIVYSAQEIAFMERQPMKLRPTGEQIDAMDEVLKWLEILEPMERKLVWKRAERIPWKLLCYEFGISRSQLNVKYDLSISKILGFLGLTMSGHNDTRQIQKNTV